MDLAASRLAKISLRSSLAKRMRLHLKQPYPITKRSEGLANMMWDAINNLNTPLSLERSLQHP